MVGVSRDNYPKDEIIRRIVETAKALKKSKSHVPVLLTDHAGYSDGSVNILRRGDYIDANQAHHEAFARLKSEGIQDISSHLRISYARLAGKMNVRYADVGKDLLNSVGKIDESLFTDGLHPNVDGYRRIAAKLAEYF